MLDIKLRLPPLQSVASSGCEFRCVYSVEHASTTRSIALSCRNRPLMYRFDSDAAATSAASMICIPQCASYRSRTPPPPGGGCTTCHHKQLLDTDIQEPPLKRRLLLDVLSAIVQRHRAMHRSSP